MSRMVAAGARARQGWMLDGAPRGAGGRVPGRRGGAAAHAARPLQKVLLPAPGLLRAVRPRGGAALPAMARSCTTVLLAQPLLSAPQPAPHRTAPQRLVWMHASAVHGSL